MCVFVALLVAGIMGATAWGIWPGTDEPRDTAALRKGFAAFLLAAGAFGALHLGARSLAILICGGSVSVDEAGMTVDLPGRRGRVAWSDVRETFVRVEPGGRGLPPHGTHNWALELELKASVGRINTGLWRLYSRHDLTLRQVEFEHFSELCQAVEKRCKRPEPPGKERRG